MSRLDSFIRRMQAQRDCLNHVAEQVRGMPGPILELGLGNGRTYDHLRELFPAREIFVFEREVRAHPDCVPPAEFLFKGDIHDTLNEAATRLGPTAILAHTDLGTGEKEANEKLGRFLGPAIDRLMAPGALVLANQKLHVPRWTRLPEPPDVKPDRYFIYRVG
jgi:hypothetical protein